VLARRPLATVLATAAAVLAGCGTDDAGAPVALPPDRWKPWIVASGDAIAVPAPPRPGSSAERADQRAAADAARAREAPAGRELIERWTRGPAVGPWIARALSNVARHTKNPPAASRAYALVSIAMHDAVVVADRARRRSGRGGHPSPETAVAGAASRVLSHLYAEEPQARLDADAREAARAFVAAGSATLSAADAGLELGRAVAAQVIERASADDVGRRWTGRPPTGRGTWRPPPGSVARPVAPLAATWQTWALPSGTSVRPPPPPRYGSPEFVAEAREVIEVSRRLTPEQTAIAGFWAGGQGTALPPGIWNQVALEAVRSRRLTTIQAARVFAALNVGMSDAGIAIWDAKYAYWSPRPLNAIRDLGIDPDFKSLIPTPVFPSYPSGHSGYSGAAAGVLAHFFPDQTRLFDEKALEATNSRLYGGIHYRTDNDVGLKLGRAVARYVIERLRTEERRG